MSIAILNRKRNRKTECSCFTVIKLFIISRMNDADNCFKWKLAEKTLLFFIIRHY